MISSFFGPVQALDRPLSRPIGSKGGRPQRNEKKSFPVPLRTSLFPRVWWDSGSIRGGGATFGGDLQHVALGQQAEVVQQPGHHTGHGGLARRGGRSPTGAAGHSGPFLSCGRLLQTILGHFGLIFHLLKNLTEKSLPVGRSKKKKGPIKKGNEQKLSQKYASLNTCRMGKHQKMSKNNPYWGIFTFFLGGSIFWIPPKNPQGGQFFGDGSGFWLLVENWQGKSYFLGFLGGVEPISARLDGFPSLWCAPHWGERWCTLDSHDTP